MNIFVLADPDLPVPPALYGGIERVVALLVDGLHARGHAVTLFAHRDSRVSCEHIAWPGLVSSSRTATVRNAWLVARETERRRPHVVHSFARLACLVPILPAPVPKIMSYQRLVTPRTVTLARRLSFGSLTFTGCSRRLIAPVERLGRWRVVYNAVPVDRYRFADSVPGDAPLVFLGRVEHIKGTHLAIDVARRAGRRLVIAGNVPDTAGHQRYFREAIQPHVNGDTVRYAGPVDDAAKSELLSRAAALLMPVLWDEPFGIVMAEALACGTPVIGLNRGAVPEVVEQGITGFVSEDADGMVAAVADLGRLDRARCRVSAERRFSQPSLVDAYEALYAERAGRPEPGAAADAVRPSTSVRVP